MQLCGFARSVLWACLVLSCLVLSEECVKGCLRNACGIVRDISVGSSEECLGLADRFRQTGLSELWDCLSCWILSELLDIVWAVGLSELLDIVWAVGYCLSCWILSELLDIVWAVELSELLDIVWAVGYCLSCWNCLSCWMLSELWIMDIVWACWILSELLDYRLSCGILSELLDIVWAVTMKSLSEPVGYCLSCGYCLGADEIWYRLPTRCAVDIAPPDLWIWLSCERPRLNRCSCISFVDFSSAKRFLIHRAGELSVHSDIVHHWWTLTTSVCCWICVRESSLCPFVFELLEYPVCAVWYRSCIYVLVAHRFS